MIYTYSPDAVVVTIGTYVVKGITSVQIKYNERPFKIVRGIRGTNTRVRSQDTSAVVTINLQQTSQANTVFSEIVRQDLLKGTARLQVNVNDIKGGSFFSSETGFLDGLPDHGYNIDVEARAWNIHCLSSTSDLKGGYTAIDFASAAGIFDL